MRNKIKKHKLDGDLFVKIFLLIILFISQKTHFHTSDLNSRILVKLGDTQLSHLHVL